MAESTPKLAERRGYLAEVGGSWRKEKRDNKLIFNYLFIHSYPFRQLFPIFYFFFISIFQKRAHL